MSRSKQRATADVCADCGALEPRWASINRAILLCDECCSIHRSLGRHISQVKCLHKGLWNPHLLNMVHTLNDNGANSIWEHSLLDPSNSKISRRKPQAKDPLHPVKADFIRTKHQQLSFVLRPSKDDNNEDDLSKQLHSSVRTSNLETSLRLLAQGANPNYFYKEKGTTPLHVAARAGQSSQLELLIANGGNPSLMDSSGQNSADIAKISGHLELHERLVECMYEVTDRLTYFLCNRKPDHKSGEHLIIPDWGATLERNELAYEARNKLQMLSNHLLEELAMDVYDEVDRRETDAIWLANTLLPEQCSVPFLPVNPQLSSTRNQGRQKLARFTPKEFATLVIDLLTEAGRRHKLNNATFLQDPAVAALRRQQLFGKRGSQMSDDEPLYDSVASDDDYGTLSNDKKNQYNKTSPNEKSTPTVTQDSPTRTVEVLKQQLNLSETTIKDLQCQIQTLRSTVAQVLKENRELKSALQSQAQNRVVGSEKVTNGHMCIEKDEEHEAEMKSASRANQRPASMYETREGLRKSPAWHQNINQPKRDCESVPRPGMNQSVWEYNAVLPPREEVDRRTEQVTKRIQELARAMQDPSHREAFVPCAERIRTAVVELTAIFPQNSADDNIRTALRQLNGNTGRLQAECAGLQRCTSDPEHMDRCLQQVRSCAYDIAKATKLLVTQFQMS